MKISQTVSELLSGHDFRTEIYKGADFRKNCTWNYSTCFFAHRLMMFYICAKSEGLRVIEWTQFSH